MTNPQDASNSKVEQDRLDYISGVNKIKKRLTPFTKESVLIRGLASINNSCNIGNIEFLQCLPDITFLLIKWKMLQLNSGSRQIKDKEIHELKQQIFNLQKSATSLDGSRPIHLALRSFIMPQANWQHIEANGYLPIFRQHIWFSKDKNKDYYEQTFFNETGISLKNYFLISLYLVYLIHSHTDSKLAQIELSKLILDLSPGVSLEEIAAFVNLTASIIPDLPFFFDQYRDACVDSREYFQGTPFFQKPFLLKNSHIIIVCNKLAAISLINIVPNLFKKMNGRKFKENFGWTFEKYVEDILARTNIHFTVEQKIKEVLIANQISEKKVCDFVIEDLGRIFIDAKAIEPNDFFISCSDQTVLAERLKESFTKAVFQIQATCQSYTLIPGTVNKNSFGLVVLHQDFFISTAEKIERDINPSLSNELIAEFGQIYVPLKNIYYMTIGDFERLMTALPTSNMSITEFLNDSIERDKNPQTSTMNFLMHLSSLNNNSVHNDKKLLEVVDILNNELLQTLSQNKQHWDSDIIKFQSAFKNFSALLN